MMSVNRLSRWVSGALIIVACTSTSLDALNTSTHRLINLAAAETETFNTYLRNALGLRNGHKDQLTGRNGVRLSVADWLGLGGEREDDGPWLTGRFYNHFHNPLKPWSEAGLRVLRQHPSSVHWMQHPNQEPGGNWAWKDARRLYLQALTAPDAPAREEAAADLFRALGQIMHLVVDASVPEHARDDPHPFGTISRELLNRRKAGNYEYWVSDQHARAGPEEQAEAQFVSRFLSNPIGFDTRILRMPSPPGEAIATVPIARLIDTDTYTAEAPDPNLTLGGAIGLAEFASANFFSENTVDGRFPFPRRDALVPSPRVAPRSSGVRAYLAKPAGQGQPTDVALAECAADRAVGRWVVGRGAPYPCVDEAVWEETARHLLPRAVGYARGVLDYFFRGRLRIVRVSAPAGGVFIEVQNTSDETMEGVFEIYARHQKGSPAERRQLATVLNGGGPITLAPRRRVELPLQIPPGGPTPYHVLVFRGRLGLEEDAVVAQVFTVADVQVLQDSYDVDVRKTCTGQAYQLPGAWGAFGERINCTMMPVNHRVHARIVTNFAGGDPADPTQPAIDRIQAVWFGSAGGPAPLMVNGVLYPSGLWTRGEEDGDPSSVSVLDPAPRGSSILFVIVYLRNADGATFSQWLATFAEAFASYDKSATFRVFEGDWRVVAGRVWRVTPLVGGAYRAVSIGGFRVPTVRNIVNETLQVFATGGAHGVNDVAETFPSRDLAAARLAGLALDPRFPEPPELHWSAVVRSLPVLTGALQFRNAFVADGEPPPHEFAMTGRELEP